MRNLKIYITALNLLFFIVGYSQMQIDHSLILTGSGSNARVSGIQNVSSGTDAVSVQALQNGALVFAPSTGSANTFSVSISPAITSYQTGMVINFISNQSVSGPATLSVNGLAPVPLVKYTNVPLSGCEIITGQAVSVLYDGTNFQILSLLSIAQSVGTPVATTGSVVSSSQITATWNPATNATGYYLDVATDSGFASMLQGYNNLSVGNVTSYNVTSGISCGNTYYYRVRATNNCGASANSNKIMVVIPHFGGYVPVTITNNASSGTDTNFQQMITVNSSTYSTYENSGLQNVEFTAGGPAGTGTVLQAWIESGNTNSSTNTVYWINLGSNIISANGGTLTIYMNFMGNSVLASSGPLGEAGQLSATYGQYDNGASVFNFYDNFAGTSLNTTLWTSNLGGCYSINNGLTYIVCSSTDFLQSTSTFNSVVVDEYVKPTNSGWIGFAVPGNYGSRVGVLFYNQLGWGMYNGSSQIADHKSYTTNDFYTISGAVSGGVANLSVNYVSDLTSGASYYPNTTSYLELANGNQGTGFLQWIRVRNYPPSLTMPTVAFGSLVTGC